MFVRGHQYTRANIRKLLGLEEARGGAWATGHVRHGGEHYIFCGIKTAGRTGVDHDNHFVDGVLIWHARADHRLESPVLADLVSGTAPVHVFYRSGDRDPFTYGGNGHPVLVKPTPPVEVHWSFDELSAAMAEEVLETQGVIEGAKKQITVNAYERDPTAKPRCIKRWGTLCAVCGFDFGAVYGELGAGFIHVHHLTPIATIGEEYVLDPELHLRPVCPNCHAMLHRRKDRLLSIEELQKLLRRRFDQAFAPAAASEPA